MVVLLLGGFAAINSYRLSVDRLACVAAQPQHAGGYLAGLN
jgi:hypothetical protein